MVEERVSVTAQRTPSPVAGNVRSVAMAVNDIQALDEPRIKLPSGELNRVLGGGLVPGSLVLLGGEPGIGKSTLVLQNLLSIKSKTILYVSGEESATQLKLRADRIGRGSDNCFIVCETSLENIFRRRSTARHTGNRLNPDHSLRCHRIVSRLRQPGARVRRQSA